MVDNAHAYELLAERLIVQGFDVERIKNALKSQRIETPSWGYGNSGTRFKVFPWPGAARDVYEKLADAACVFRFTGVTPSVALHIPWDKVHDWEALKQYAATLGVRIGAINPNLFQFVGRQYRAHRGLFAGREQAWRLPFQQPQVRR